MNLKKIAQKRKVQVPMKNNQLKTYSSDGYTCSVYRCYKPFRTGVVVALGEGSSSGVGVGRGAAAALQTQQEAQGQTQNQSNYKVALTIRYLHRKRSTAKIKKLKKKSNISEKLQCCEHTLCIKAFPLIRMRKNEARINNANSILRILPFVLMCDLTA